MEAPSPSTIPLICSLPESHNASLRKKFGYKRKDGGGNGQSAGFFYIVISHKRIQGQSITGFIMAAAIFRLIQIVIHIAPDMLFVAPAKQDNGGNAARDHNNAR